MLLLGMKPIAKGVRLGAKDKHNSLLSALSIRDMRKDNEDNGHNIENRKEKDGLVRAVS